MERPLSVHVGHDSPMIDALIDIHCEALHPRIVDCTANRGAIWRTSQHTPLRMDRDDTHPIHAAGDFFNLPIRSHSIDVLVFDPPHLPTAAASEKSSGIWMRKYGIDADSRRGGNNISRLFGPFLHEARRVLVPGGIVLAKIADIVHNHRYQWQHVDFINAAHTLRLTPCDMMIKTTPASGNLKSGRWQQVKHVRRAHSYWIVVRNAPYDERKRHGK